MIDLNEAYDRLFRHVLPGPVVEVALADAAFRTLAAPVRCDIDYPPFDRAVMDGYAVRSSDVAGAPVTLRVVGQVPAGVTVTRRVGAGEAMQINTGAPMPNGADAVVRVEATEADETGGKVLVRSGVSPGTFVTPRADYAASGDVVLEAGTLLTPLAIGAAASAGAVRVPVYRRPTVAVVSTGDELVDIAEKPSGAQIRNSNSYLMSSMIEQCHATPRVFGIACDSKQALKAVIEEALSSDVVCITGGVSMGAFDFVPDVLRECGATFIIQRLPIKPGRPIIVATTSDGTPVFALPGNPASAFVGFELLVKPALAAREGRRGVRPRPLRARLVGTVKPTGERRTYLPATATVGEDGLWTVIPLPWHGSGDVFGMAKANALVIRDPHTEMAAEGDEVSMLSLGDWSG